MMASFDLEIAHTLQLLEAFEASLNALTTDSTSGRRDETVTAATRNHLEGWVEEHLGENEQTKEQEEMRNVDGTDECPICYERRSTAEMIVLLCCSHLLCRHCLLQYVEVQMKVKQVPMPCPQNCSQQLDLDQIRAFLDPAIVEAFAKCLAEACIPDSQKVYCPFPECSALMSRDDGGPAVESECMECHRLFCVGCRVPWHSGKSCAQYQSLLPEERDKEDAQLDQLAKRNKWQRCKKCQIVVSLYRGCNHITCRCGHEFCYVCGEEWRNKSATCRCSLWDESNIRF